MIRLLLLKNDGICDIVNKAYWHTYYKIYKDNLWITSVNQPYASIPGNVVLVDHNCFLHARINEQSYVVVEPIRIVSESTDD